MKGMSKIIHGSDFFGVLDYCLNHDDPEIISSTISQSTAEHMAAEFEAIAEQRNDIKKPVWHNALRLPEGEHLSAKKWQEVAQDYMSQMRVPEGTQWLAIKHNNEEGEHIHIIANRVLSDGSVLSSSHESMRSTRVIADLEKSLEITQSKIFPLTTVTSLDC